MLIYYSGNLDHSGNILNPVVIRGFDEAGNAIAKIRQGPLTGIIFNDFYYFYAYNSSGDNVYCHSPYCPVVYPKAMAADIHGRIYCASAPVGAYTGSYYSTDYIDAWIDFFRVYRRNGDRVPFPQLHGGPINAVFVDSSGNIYVGGVEVGPSKYILRKYDSAGSLLWSAPASSLYPSLPDVVNGIAVDGSGNVYTAGGKTNGGGLIRKYDSSGTLLWTQRPAGQQTDVVLDGSGNVYTMGARCAGYWITDTYYTPWGTLPGFVDGGEPSTSDFYFYTSPNRQYHSIQKWLASDGSYINSVNGGDAPRAAYGGGVLHSVNYYADGHRRYDGSLTLLSSSAMGDENGHNIAASSSGNLYCAAIRDMTQESLGSPYYVSYGALWHFQAVDSSDSKLWTGLAATGEAGTNKSGGAWTSAPLYASLEYTTAYGDTAGPDQAINGSGLNVEFWSVRAVCLVEGSTLPALSIPLYIASLTLIGDRYAVIPAIKLSLLIKSPRVIRDYTGPQLPQVVTAKLGGVLLSIASLRCTRDEFGMTINIVVPVNSSFSINDILSGVGDTLYISRGIKKTDGGYELNDFLSAAVTDYQYNQGSRSSSISITAKSTEFYQNKQSRTVSGISYRNTTSGGGRRIRCEIDTYLRPQDTAMLGGEESMEVSEITYYMSPVSGFMEISE